MKQRHGLLDSPSSGLDCCCFLPPESVEAEAPDAAKGQVVPRGVREWTTLKEIEKHTVITLEGGDEVVAIAANLITQRFFGVAPFKAALITHNISMEAIIWMGNVTTATPNGVTWPPVSPGVLIIGAE
jgi:hypothetical protein